jgi:hypothetical protein
MAFSVFVSAIFCVVCVIIIAAFIGALSSTNHASKCTTVDRRRSGSGSGIMPVVPLPHAASESTKSHEHMKKGTLVNKPGEDTLSMPLYGRRLYGNRFVYYTTTEKGDLWQVNVQHKHRDCQATLGCAEIKNGDDVVVPDFANKTMRAVIY